VDDDDATDLVVGLGGREICLDRMVVVRIEVIVSARRFEVIGLRLLWISSHCTEAKEADSGQHDLETEVEHVQILGERAQSSQIAVTSKSSRAINSSKFFEPVAKTAKRQWRK